MSQEFSELPELVSPFKSDDQILVVRGGQTYRASLDPSFALGTQSGSRALEWVVFQIRNTYGQEGGAFHPPNQWLSRPFNFKSTGFGSITTGGQLVLPSGNYCFRGWTTGMENGRMRGRFRSMDSLINWPSATTYSLHYSWHIPIEGVFTITTQTTFVLEMRCDRDRSKSWGYGYESQISPELYASLLFFRNSL
ncbi:hypothetical protein [Leptothoe spongobia]|uniref:Uncharacterized protein n=1 Tax=Leptothoe spongobia TAU-MAC 1115 TaxID=1967444 RepID=A0A947DFY4_9CYAN|nr:hypothetical protein [Leptothoe spongobia]MBT9316372.1 hypothetical protein [Leptothoe spongobia TAU-MAC 1115]